MMTEEQRAKQREYKRRWNAANPDRVAAWKRRYREKHTDQIAFYAFDWRQRNAEKCRQKRDAWIARHPEQRRDQQRNKPSTKRKRLRRGRLRTIAAVKDKAALGERILANAIAAIPANVGADLRTELAGMMAQRVYEGRYPIRLKPEHAKEVMTDHFREFSKFGPVSLDGPRFDDGASTLHDTISEGMWQ